LPKVVVWQAAGDAGADSIGNESEVPHAYDRLAIAVVEMVLARCASEFDNDVV